MMHARSGDNWVANDGVFRIQRQDNGVYVL